MGPCPLPPRPAFTGHTRLFSQKHQNLPARPRSIRPRGQLPQPSNLPPRPPLIAIDTDTLAVGSTSMREAATTLNRPRYNLRSHHRSKPAIPDVFKYVPETQGVLKRKLDATEDEAQDEALARKAIVCRRQEQRNEATRAQMYHKHKQDRKERQRRDEARTRKAAILEKRKHNPNHQSQSHVPATETVSTRTRSKITYDDDYEEPFYLYPRALANLRRPYKAPSPRKNHTTNPSDSDSEHEHNKRANRKAAKGVCRWYIQKKCTRHPSECNYAHPTGALFLECAKALEDQAGEAEPAVVLVREPDGKRVCHKYLRGQCHKRPEKCRFGHLTGEAFGVAVGERRMVVE